MIKRSFFALGQPKLYYDLLEADPKEPDEIPLPANLTFFLREPIINGKDMLIHKGDKVEKGERIRLYSDSQEYALSPVTGIVNNVDVYIDAFGEKGVMVAVTHNPDTNSSALDLTPEESVLYVKEFLKALPGGIPVEKFSQENFKINTMVITGTDDDLLATTNQYAAYRYTEEIKRGASILQEITGISKLCFTIPKGMKSGINFSGFEVFEIDRIYPSALPAMIMKNHLNLILPPGRQPEDAGVCFIRAEAVAALSRVYDQKSLSFEKIVTLIDKTGSSKRVKAVIGTPIASIFNKFNINVEDHDRIIINGPMQGFSTYTVFHPVTLDMDSIIVQSKSDIPCISDYACINCGQCIKICPANVPVNMLVRYLEAELYEDAAYKFDLESCIECGLCAYVCRAGIPLFQFIRLGKQQLQRLRTDD